MADVEQQQQQEQEVKQEPQEPVVKEEAEEQSEAVEAPTEQTENGNDNGDDGEEAKPEETKPAEEPEEDEDDRKIFVGGLSWDTQEAGLKDYMSEFGEVKSCTIKKDSRTGRSRCFGFVIFESAASLEKVKATEVHKLDGKDIDVKKAEPQRREGKLFVGGVKPETTDEMIKDYFGNFGKIEKFERPFDPKQQKPKGFCFLTFTKDGPIKEITEERFRMLDNKQVECKHAEPPFHGYGGGRGGRGGRGGMGWNQGFGGGGGGGYYNQGFGMNPYQQGNFNPGFGGYGGGYGGYGSFSQGYGGGGGYNGNFGFGGGSGGGGGNFGYSQQQSGYGKSGRGRPHMNNFKPY